MKKTKIFLISLIVICTALLTFNYIIKNKIQTETLATPDVFSVEMMINEAQNGTTLKNYNYSENQLYNREVQKIIAENPAISEQVNVLYSLKRIPISINEVEENGNIFAGFENTDADNIATFVDPIIVNYCTENCETVHAEYTDFYNSEVEKIYANIDGIVNEQLMVYKEEINELYQEYIANIKNIFNSTIHAIVILIAFGAIIYIFSLALREKTLFKNGKYNLLLVLVFAFILVNSTLKLDANEINQDISKPSESTIDYELAHESLITISETYTYELNEIENWKEGYNHDQQIPVYMYHFVTEEDTSSDPNTIPVDLLEQHIVYLLDQGYTFISMEQLYNYLVYQEPIPEKSCLLTFDDGTKEMYSLVLPLLEEYNIQATFFVIGSSIEPGNTNGGWFMNEEQLKAMINNEHSEVASHTWNMHNSSNYMTDAGYWDIVDDLNHNKNITENDWVLCYPFGYYNSDVMSAVSAAGITMAFTTEEGFVTANSNVLALPRIRVTPSDQYPETP